MHYQNKTESLNFINVEIISAKLLLLATLSALCISNSPGKEFYYNFLYANIIHFHHIKISLLSFINDGLMTIFFLVVGLEVKYEIINGSLNTFRKSTMPAIGAIGGMLVPASIYVAMNYHNAFLLKGWAIPTATDIAFSLAILSFAGSRIPFELKAYLTALAIFDDIVAILIIALFYTGSINIIFLGISFICLFLLLILNKKNIESFFPYLFIGIILWFSLLKSGIHPTLAGVAVAFMVPIKGKNVSPVNKLQHILHPWVALICLPAFAFANSGISFMNLNLGNLHLTVVLGICIGLLVGKQLGIFCASWIAVKCHIASLPDQIRWRELYAVAVIGGIGFTISLFIGSLAFGQSSSDYINSIKLGVLSGSFLSGIIGYIFLLIFCRKGGGVPNH